MEQLSPPTDKILNLCYLQHKKYSEVAEILGVSTSCVKKHITLVRDKKQSKNLVI